MSTYHCNKNAENKCPACAEFWSPRMQEFLSVPYEVHVERLLAPLRASGFEIAPLTDADIDEPSVVELIFHTTES